MIELPPQIPQVIESKSEPNPNSRSKLFENLWLAREEKVKTPKRKVEVALSTERDTPSSKMRVKVNKAGKFITIKALLHSPENSRRLDEIRQLLAKYNIEVPDLPVNLVGDTFIDTFRIPTPVSDKDMRTISDEIGYIRDIKYPEGYDFDQNYNQSKPRF